MRRLPHILLTLPALAALVACSNEAITPEITLTVDNASPAVGEPVTFSIVGEADAFAIYPGDESHEFQNSHMVVTAGLDLDQESVVLVADSLASIEPWLDFRVGQHNDDNPEGQADLVTADLMDRIDSLVGIEYTNKESAAYQVFLLINPIEPIVARSMVDNFFQDNSVSLAPDGGFSTGFPVDRVRREFTYSYSEPGIYTATLVATVVGGKTYSGSGYIEDNSATADEYNLARSFREVEITVTP